MRLRILLTAVGVALLLGCAPSGFRKVSLRVSSPYYPDRYETMEVEPGVPFPIMDLDFHGVVTDLLADFAIDTTTMKAFSRSDTLRNPAAKIEIYSGDSLIESSWAFPAGQYRHVSRRTVLIFEMLDYSAGKPYVSPPRSSGEPDGGEPSGKAS